MSLNILFVICFPPNVYRDLNSDVFSAKYANNHNNYEMFLWLRKLKTFFLPTAMML